MKEDSPLETDDSRYTEQRSMSESRAAKTVRIVQFALSSNQKVANPVRIVGNTNPFQP